MELNSWVIDHELVSNQAIINYQTNIIIIISFEEFERCGENVAFGLRSNKTKNLRTLNKLYNLQFTSNKLVEYHFNDVVDSNESNSF